MDDDSARCPLCDGAAAECSKLTVTPSHIELHCALRADSVRVSMAKYLTLARRIGKVPPFDLLVYQVRLGRRDGQAAPDLGSDT